jgi:hypothetical protein
VNFCKTNTRLFEYPCNYILDTYLPGDLHLFRLWNSNLAPYQDAGFI